MLLLWQTWKQRAGFKAREGTEVKAEISFCSRVLELSQLCKTLSTRAVETDPSHNASDELTGCLPPLATVTRLLRPLGKIVCQVITGLAKRDNNSMSTATPNIYFTLSNNLLSWRLQWQVSDFYWHRVVSSITFHVHTHITRCATVSEETVAAAAIS